MMSTAGANLSVGPPYDLAIYRLDSFDVDEGLIDKHSPYLAQLHEVWQRILMDAIGELPPVPSEVFTRQMLR